MTSRVSKKTTVVTTSTRSGAAGASSPHTPAQSPRAGGRPPSPASISRVQEKDELAGLNDRLAQYIDRVRQLETENARLSTQVRSSEEIVSREVTSIKGLYESELADARKLLDEISKEKTKLQLEVQKYKDDAENWEKKYRRRDLDCKSTEKKLLTAEAQVNDLQTKLSDAVNQRKYWEDEYNRIRLELINLEKQLEKCKKQLEDETMARVDLENRNQSLIEELAFKSQIHEKELNESRIRTETTIQEEVDGREQDYESRLGEAVRQMREDNDYQIRVTREETEALFTRKLQELKDLVEKNDAVAATARNDLKYARRRIDELSTENVRLSSQIPLLEARIQELESTLKREREDNAAALNLRDREIRKLRDQLAERWAEYQDLLDTKIQLDNEIATYRKLLESEETRLNLSQESTPRKTPKRSTPSRGTPVGSRKRKRVVALQSSEGSSGGLSFSEMARQASYSSSSGGRGDIVIEKFSEDGKCVVIRNATNKDMAVGGWQVKHTAGEEDNTYKFHRSLHIKPNETVTIWSSDAEETHNPPSNLVMKNQKWHTADEMKTIVLSSDGTEEAFLEMKKVTRMTGSSYYTSYAGSSVDEHDTAEGDPRRDEKCLIM